MKRLVLFLVLILLAVPAFAQDPAGGGGGDAGFGGLFGVGDAPANRNAPPPDRLGSLRKIMAEANTPLTKDQENSLGKMLEADIKKYTDDLEKRFPDEVAQARAAGGGRGGRGAGGAGDRGGSGGRGGRGPGLPPNSPLLAEMNRINVDLQNKVTAQLKPDQTAALKKFQNDQIKKAGGLGALKLNMQEAGIPLSADQEAQIQALYADEAQQRRQLMRDSQGQPDKAKFDALTSGTMLKIARLLTAEQKKVLLESLKKQQQ